MLTEKHTEDSGFTKMDRGGSSLTRVRSKPAARNTRRRLPVSKPLGEIALPLGMMRDALAQFRASGGITMSGALNGQLVVSMSVPSHTLGIDTLTGGWLVDGVPLADILAGDK